MSALHIFFTSIVYPSIMERRIFIKSGVSAFILTLLSLLAFIPAAFAGDSRVTPYGDYCRDCTIYGACKDLVPMEDSMAALDNYYRAKGYRTEIIKHRGRFIVAEIYRGSHIVDKVLFDRKTGRVRSIY